MAKVHAFQPPPYLADDFGSDSDMWPQLDLWMSNALKFVESGAFLCDDDKTRAAALNLPRAQSIVSELKTSLAQLPSPPSISFCHNDLLAANVMVAPTGNVQLIDFEYGGMNYACFDIANHFNEWAGGTDDSKPNYALLPSAEQKEAFIRNYVAAKCGAASSSEEIEKEIQVLKGQVSIFEVINHFYWGLWAVNQANAEGCKVFDYLNYARARLLQVEGMGLHKK